MSLTNFMSSAQGLGDLDLHASKFRGAGADPTLQKVQVKGKYGTYHLPALSALHSHAVPRVVQVNPQTSISGVAWSAMTLEFLIDRNSLHTIDSLVFQLDVTNTTGGGTAITFNSIFDQVDSIDFFLGSQRVQSINGLCLKTLLATMPHEQYLQWQANLQMTTAYVTGSSLADTASTTFFLPIIHSFLEQSARGFFLPALKNDLRVKITLSPANVALYSGSSARIDAAKLHLFGRELDPVDVAEQYKLAEGIEDFRFIDFVHQPITLGSETSGVQYSQQLNSINGLVAFLTVVNRGANPTTTTVSTYRAFTNIEVTDAAGTNMNGGNAMTDAFVRGPYANSLGLPGQIQSILNYYILSWSQSPVDCLKYGIVNGFLPMKTTHRLRYTCAATNSTGQIDVFAGVYKRLRIKQGVVESVISS